MKTLISTLLLIALLLVPCLSQNRPSLSKMLLHSTIRIVCVQTNGSSDIGTGFFYSFRDPSDTNSSIPVIVTCKHVIANSAVGILDFALAKTNAFDRTQPHFQVVIQNFESQWIKHPDTNIDVAVIPIAGIMQKLIDDGKRLDVVPFDQRQLLTTNELSQIGVFQNVKFIGYPIGISDEQNNLPIARQGMTATDVSIDYEGRKEFMIDAAVFPGSSGSPVLIAEQGSYTPMGGGLAVGNELRLLGILYAGPEFNDKGHIEFRNIPTAFEAESVTGIPCNLGLVIKAEVLNDFEKPLLDLANVNAAKK
jgi:V8-like Glu-specific endopeptidase